MLPMSGLALSPRHQVVDEQPGGHVDQADCTRIAVGHVHRLVVAAEVEAVRALAGGQQTDQLPGVRVDPPYPAGVLSAT